MEIDERYGIPKFHGLTKRQMTKLQNHTDPHRTGIRFPGQHRLKAVDLQADLVLAPQQIEFLQWWADEYARRWMES